MSSVARPLPRPAVADRPRLVARVRGDAVAVALLGAWVVLLAALTWGRWGDPAMDTGYDLLAGARTAHGELPYVDYTYYYGPLGPLALGGLYAVTGAGVWPAVALGLVLALAAVLLTYRLARLFADPVPSALAAALAAAAAFSSANNSYVLPHSTSAPLALVAALGALLALGGWARAQRPRRRPLVLAGSCCAVVALTRPETALALYGGVALWLAARVWTAGDGRRAALRDAAWVAVPAIALPLAGYGAFLAAVSPHDLLLENLYPRDYLREAGDVVLRAHAPWTAASFAKLAVHAAAYAAGLAALAVAAHAIARGGRARALAIGALAAAAVLFVAVLAARPDTVRYYLEWAWMWVPVGAWVAVVALLRGRRRPGPALLLAGVLAVAATTTYARFTPFPNALHPDSTAYLMPLAATFLVWSHVVVAGRGRTVLRVLVTAWIALLALADAALVVGDARDETTAVRGPHGRLTARPADGPALQAATTLLLRETRPGEPVLLAPQLTALYVLTDRRDPLRQLSLLPGSLATPGAEDEAIARLDGVRLALVDRTPQTTYDHGAFGATFDRRLAAALHRDFRRIATVRGSGGDARVIDVLKRKSPS